jgi:apolipoprotein N-acyltransferase
MAGGLESWPWLSTLALCSAALSALSSLYPGLFILGWIALVPFVVGLQLSQGLVRVCGFAFLTGLLTFGLSTYWMAEFITIFKGYSYAASIGLASVYWCYCALMFVVIGVVTHFGKQRGTQFWLFPLALSAVFAFFPVLFPWQLGNAQHPFLVAIQAVDITGVSGLDFIVGLANVLFAQALLANPMVGRIHLVAAYGLIVVWFGYGFFSLQYWDKTGADAESLSVGLVQIDGPPSTQPPAAVSGYSLSYPPEMALTEQLVARGAQLVIWPEYDRQFYNLEFVQRSLQRQVAALATPLILHSVEYAGEGGQTQKFSSATLLNTQGKEDGKYQKIKRIAVAEYLPWFNQSPLVKQWVRSYLGGFFGDYQAGSQPVGFKLGPVTLTPLICYEVILPRFVAGSVKATHGNIITVQSNNSWFGNTRVPYLHMGASVLRSVENRRSLIHVMNNGLGGVVAPSGRVLLQTEHQQVAGYLAQVPFALKDALTFYQRTPWLTLSVVLLCLVTLMARRREQ